MTEYRSGFCALVGRPNVGKSTLLNALVGEKLAIVSEKPQTTRNRILGVLHREQGQIILLDTPGWQRPRHRLGSMMLETTRRAARDVDVVAMVVEAHLRPGPGDRHIARALEEGPDLPRLLIINKLDLVNDDPQPRIQAYRDLTSFTDAICVSALKGTGLSALEKTLFQLLPPGPPYFPEDMATDQPERQLMAELIREQVLHLTREEVPHSVGILMEEISPRPDGMLYVRAVVFVERPSQKGIIIGRGGSMLRQIGQRARESMEAILGSRIYLDLFVKVVPDWRDRRGPLQELGYGKEGT